jgi:hypothetical protein
MRVTGAMLDPDEARERSAEGITPGSAGPIALDHESVILRRRRWPARVAWVFAFLAVFGWFWWNFFSPGFGSLSSQRNGEDSLLELAGPAYLQDDTNLVKLVQNRLRNLGYQVGPVDGVVGPKTMKALERFQMKQDLPVTSVLDHATKDALEKLPLPKEETPPYMVARVRQRQEESGKRLQVDLSVDPVSEKETVEGYVRKVLGRYAERHPEVNAIQIRAYLGIASLAPGAYIIADWERPAGEPFSDPGAGVKIEFQEWAREAPPGLPQLSPPER